MSGTQVERAQERALSGGMKRKYRRSVRRVTIVEPYEYVTRSITVELAADLRIKEIAAAQGTTYSGAVGEAIESYVAAHD